MVLVYGQVINMDADMNMVGDIINGIIAIVAIAAFSVTFAQGRGFRKVNDNMNCLSNR